MTIPNINYGYRFRIWRFFAAMVTIVVATTALIVTTITARPVETRIIDIDGSASVGADFLNKYIPTACSVVRNSVGKRIVVVLFGGRTETIFDAVLTPDTAATLQSELLARTAWSKEVKGSPITERGVSDAIYLHSLGKHGLLVLVSDGNEEPFDQRFHVQPDCARGVSAILYGMEASAPVVQALRLAGVDVTVAQSPQSVNAALNSAVAGLPPFARTARNLSIPLLLLGLISLPTAFFSRRVTAPEIVSVPEPTLGPTEPEGYEVLKPLVLRLTATLEGDHPITVHRRLRCNGSERLLIARTGATSADLTVPLHMLPVESVDAAVEIRPIDLARVRVINIGKVPVVAGAHRIMPGEQDTARASDGLFVGPFAKVSLVISPEVD